MRHAACSGAACCAVASAVSEWVFGVAVDDEDLLDDGGDIGDGSYDDAVGGIQLSRISLSMKEAAVDDSIGTSNLAWRRYLPVDVGFVEPGRFGVAVVCDCP